MLDLIQTDLGREEEQAALREQEFEVTTRETEVQVPFDMEAFIQQQNAENRILLDDILAKQQQEREAFLQNIEKNQRFIDESIRNQKDERDVLLQNIMELSRNQSEDRKLFSRTIMILVGGSIFIALFILLGFMLILKRRTIPQGTAVSYEALPTLGVRPQALLEYADGIDESKYITDDRYSDMVQAKQLGHLYSELKEGNLSWDTLQGYIAELNHEMKSSILNVVEEKLKSGEVKSNKSAMDILLPFLTDGESDISTTSQQLLTELAGSSIHALPEEETDDPLGYNALLQFAHMVDAKTGRLNHSVHVSVLAEKMASMLNDPELEPDTVKLVGLVHDIGYLEIDDSLLRMEGKLNERQFNIIKTHTECGLHMLKHVDLPSIFIDGITYHHERLDGSGYPKGLLKGKIPKIARLLAVADFFDAVTSLRPHRPAKNIKDGIKMVEELSGDKLDRSMVKLLLEMHKDKLEN
jgi:putative nucleotidyltransferase with HDIG domain